MQELQPQIAELLRTCIHPPSLRLRVAHVKVIEVNRDNVENSHNTNDPLLQSIDSAHRYATKLVLSDGQLMIQSLLHRKLSTLGDVAGLSIGDLIEIKSFQVKKSSKVNGLGHVIYLAIEDCHLLKEGHLSQYNRTETKLLGKRSRSATESTENNTIVLSSGPDEGDVFYSAEESLQRSPKRVKLIITKDSADYIEEPKRAARTVLDKTSSKSPKRVSFTSPILLAVDDPAPEVSVGMNANKSVIEKASDSNVAKGSKLDSITKTPDPESRIDDDEGDFFESTKTNRDVINQRRQVLRNLDLNLPGRNSSFDFKADAVGISEGSASQDLQQVQAIQKPLSQPSNLLTFQPSPPFHTLGSLRCPPANNPLPAKSYSLTTLGFITWTGSNLIHRPGSPFPPKRHLKIIDPSLSTTQPSPRGETASTQTNPIKTQPDVPLFKSQNSFQEAVTLAVYLDAANFKPSSGILALFRGVVMQRLANGDVILNVYARLKDIRFDDQKSQGDDGRQNLNSDDCDNHWFITDHDKIRSLGHGSKLEYYLDWWRDRNV